MLGQLDAKSQEAVWLAIADALTAYETPTGFCGPCELVIAAGTK